MNRTRLVLMFVLALLVAGAASLAVLMKLRQSSKAAASTFSVVTAARDLELGTKLGEADVKLAEWSAGQPPAGALTDPSKVVGRAILYPMFKEELVLEGKLAPVGAGAGMAAVIPEGMRAVSIRVDDVVAVAGFVGPSTRVDVLLTGNPGGHAGSQALTKTILENVQVLAAGQKIQPDNQGKPETVNVVTLLCTPQDAAKVTLAASEGRIQLVLRNPTDKRESEKQAMVQRQALYGEALPKPPAPAPRKVRTPPPPPVVAVAPPPPPPPATTSIEILRGEARSKVELPASASQLLVSSPGEKNR